MNPNQKALGSEPKHLCGFEPKNLPSHIGRLAILDPDGLHPDNLERHLAKQLANNPDHLQVDVETKGKPFRERYPEYTQANNRDLKTLEVIRQLECENVDYLQRRFPRYPIHFWVNGNHQSNLVAVKRLDNISPNKDLPSLLRMGAIADAECYYKATQSFSSWKVKQLDGESRIRLFREIWPGPACLCVNVNDRFGTQQIFNANILAGMVEIADELKYEYIGWFAFKNETISRGDFNGLELANWREVVSGS